MKNLKKLKICVIGIGKVGSALTLELMEKGFNVRYLISNNKTILRKFIKTNPRVSYSDHLEKSYLNQSDIIIISVQDKYVPDLILKLKNTSLNLSKKYIFHTSGFLSSNVFMNIKISKKRIGSFHPVQTFNKTSYRNTNLFRGIYCGIEAGIELRKLLIFITKSIDSNYVLVPQKDKPIYHFACAYSSNYLVTYLAVLDKLLSGTSIKPVKNFKIFLPIVKQTLMNLEHFGFAESLTGPFERKDFSVIEGHLRYLKENLQEMIPLYLYFGKSAISLSSQHNYYSKSEMAELEKIFDKYSKY